jgi:hypothetical protein
MQIISENALLEEANIQSGEIGSKEEKKTSSFSEKNN